MMKISMHRFILGIVIRVLVINAAALELKEGLDIWPMPESMESGVGNLYMNNEFQLKTDGSKYVDHNGILKDGFSRLIDVVKGAHVIESHVSKSHPSSLLHGINVVVFSQKDELQYGVNESYRLSIPGNGDKIYANLEAETIYGALHGLQTFSQLCYFNFTSRTVEIRRVPLRITDKPRFSYRGLLIDTSRHYQPLPMIKKVIDSMAYAKLNVLHWHIVDSQSFPLEIPSFPKMWEGSYSIAERYTMADAAEIVSYAQRRGISVLSEIDVPGHALSWGAGYPSLWPSADCKEPLDISNEFTFQVIDGILSDFSKVFKYKFVHLGGDEVNTSCWTLTARVKDWLTKTSKTEYDGYEYFVLRTQEIALKHGFEIVNWEETFNNFGSKLNPKTVVHNWLESGVAGRVTAAGLRCIVSNQDKWYLDHLDATWLDFYMNEPLSNINDAEQQKLVIGGEVCMWGETIDASDIEQTIWPRAAAAAERLWTASEKLGKDQEEIKRRLTLFRCLLNERGVAAAPLGGLGRDAPVEPGSCYSQ